MHKSVWIGVVCVSLLRDRLTCVNHASTDKITKFLTKPSTDRAHVTRLRGRAISIEPWKKFASALTSIKCALLPVPTRSSRRFRSLYLAIRINGRNSLSLPQPSTIFSKKFEFHLRNQRRLLFRRRSLQSWSHVRQVGRDYGGWHFRYDARCSPSGESARGGRVRRFRCFRRPELYLQQGCTSIHDVSFFHCNVVALLLPKCRFTAICSWQVSTTLLKRLPLCRDTWGRLCTRAKHVPIKLELRFAWHAVFIVTRDTNLWNYIQNDTSDVTVETPSLRANSVI